MGNLYKGESLKGGISLIFMASIEKEILRQSVNKPLTWKRFIDDVLCILVGYKQRRNRTFH